MEKIKLVNGAPAPLIQQWDALHLPDRENTLNDLSDFIFEYPIA